jgi:uncharacterized protein Yka (UPF0111/DUF47 family)
MGFGSTAKKLQKVADMAEDVYARLTALREEVEETRETVESTAERTERLEAEVAEQRAMMDRLLEANGLDPDVERRSLDSRETAGDRAAPGEAEDVDATDDGVSTATE